MFNGEHPSASLRVLKEIEEEEERAASQGGDCTKNLLASNLFFISFFYRFQNLSALQTHSFL